MSTTPVVLDFSKAMPIGGNPPPPTPAASALQGAVSYATQQDPAKYAHLLDLQKRTGIPPVVSSGNEQQVKQQADANSIDPEHFAATAPRTAGWAATPDNAAVSGVDELHRLSGIEQNATQMRAYTPTLGDKVSDKLLDLGQWMMGGTISREQLRQNFANVTRYPADVASGTASMIGNVGSFFGLHGDGPMKENLLQRIGANLDPVQSNGGTPLDWVAKNVAPMVPAMMATGGSGLLARTLGLSDKAAKVLSGLTVGGMFTADQAGRTYTSVAGSGGSDYAARLAANRVAAINALPNALFGATDVVPLLRDNPLLTSLGLGGATGAAGQVSQNVVTGQPWGTDIGKAAVQGAAMQGGMHVGFGAFMGEAVDAAEQSKLRERSPEKFQEAMQTIFAGDQSLRIPAEKFNEYFQGKGMDPAQVASSLGSTNYTEAYLSGGDVEVHPADFIGKLDPEHQKALLPDIVDPATNLTARQHQEGREELEQWATGGGADKLVADTQAADAETAASPEFQEVKEQLRQKYADAGETPEVAETLAEKDAHVYSNLARQVGMKPNELMGLYNPKVATGEAPGSVLYQSGVPMDGHDGKATTVLTPAREQPASDPAPSGEGSAGVTARGWFRVKSDGSYEIGKTKIGDLSTFVHEPAHAYLHIIGDLAKREGVESPVQQGFKRLYHGSAEHGRYEGAAWFSTSRDYARDYRTGAELQHVDIPLAKWREMSGEDIPNGIAGVSSIELDSAVTGRRKPTISGGASETLKGDYGKILDFLGAKDGDTLSREQQETWARANEQYLREGKAPSPGLKGAFQRFSIWLGSVYKKASDLGVTLSDDIRGVFDRLYAAEDGVNKAETEAGPKLFSTPEEAGWTEEQFKDYADQNRMTVEQAKSDILGKLNEAAIRDRSEAWREEEKNVRSAVTTEVDQRPEYAAIRALRKGALDDGTPLTMSREELVKQFGEDRVKGLQKQHPGLYRNEGGIEPETAAEILGFKSADEMMKSLETAPRRSAAIDQSTRDYMTAKHGDIRYDGSLDDQARLALENDSKAKGLYGELEALKKKLADTKAKAAGQKAAIRAIDIAPISAYREAAGQMIDSKAVADLQPTRYLDASRKYSREAFDALRTGDAEKAAEAKHKELMNHFLFRSATEAKEYISKFESYAKRMQSKGVQQKLGLAGSDYRDQFNKIMGRYGLGPDTKTERPLSEWADEQYEAGKEPAIASGIYDESRTVAYRNASVAEIRQVHDALINVRKLASLDLGMTVNGRKVEFNSAIENMSARARESMPTKPTRVLKGNATLGEKVADLAQRGDALLMRTERLVEWLDGGKSGPWHDNLWHLAADVQGHEYKLQGEVTKRLGDAREAMPKEQRDRMMDKVAVEGIPETVTRKDLVSMAFNMGNEGNLDRLQKTFAAHGWDISAIEQVKGMLTREEWKFVQDGWDSLKPLGTAQAEMEKRLTGLPPVMVTPTPLHLKLADGSEMDLEGGYYPVVMDPRFSARGATQDAGTRAQNIMETGYGRAATSRGAMKERTGFGGPLLLDHEQVLSQHTAQVIKDITHREFMLVGNKLLTNDAVRQSMRETLGEGYEEKMMPWLRSIINDRNGSGPQGLGDFSRMMGALRTNLTLATLSFKVSTSLLQWTHAPRMLLSTRPGSFAQAMVDFLAHPSDMTEQIKGLSPNEMAHRGENLNRDIRATLQGDPGIQRKVAQVGNITIKYTDHLLSFPLWLSVYRDALKQHVDLTEDAASYQAMHQADSAVRLALGAGSPKDLPPIMRSNDLSKMLTMFYSFHNGIYGQVRDIVHQSKGMRDVPKMTYGLAMSVLVPAILSSLVTGQGPKDDENKGLWAAKKALLFAGGMVPLLRDAASAMDGDGDVKFTPLVNVMSKGVKATQKATADKEDKDWTGIGLDYLEVGGDLAGVPGTTQVMKPIRYGRQVQKGNVDDPNVWDATVGTRRK